MRALFPAVFFLTSIILAAVAPRGEAALKRSQVANAPAVCDASDALALIRVIEAQHQRSKAVKFLRWRIAECQRQIKGAQATPNPMPPWYTPAPSPKEPWYCVKLDSSADEFTLYADLVDCVAYLKLVATPAPPSPAPILASQPTFYVFSTGTTDQASNAFLVRSVVDRLITSQNKTPLAQLWLVVGRTDWTSPSSFTTQCQGDPNTEGALLIEDDYPTNYSNNWLLWVHTGARLDANFELLGCDMLSRNGSTSPLSVWFGRGANESTFNEESTTGGAPLAVWGALAVVFSQGKTTVNTSTTGGTTTTVNNLTPAFAATTLASALGSTTVPSANASWLLSNAAWRVTGDLFSSLRQQCSSITSNTRTLDRSSFQLSLYCRQFNAFTF